MNQSSADRDSSGARGRRRARSRSDGAAGATASVVAAHQGVEDRARRRRVTRRDHGGPTLVRDVRLDGSMGRGFVACACLVGLVAGCEYSYRQRQVGLVPPPRPATYDGQPMAGVVRVEGHASRVVTPLEPASAPTGSSTYVARDTIGGGLFVRAGETELGMSVDAARSRSAVPVGPMVQDPVPEGPAYSVVFALRRAIRASESVSVGLAGEFGLVGVPIRLGDGGRSSSDSAGIYRVAIVPSWRAGALALFGGMHLTNDFEVPSEITIDPDHSSEASASGAVFIASAGASVRIGDGLKLSTQIAKPFTSTVEHGVQLDVVLGFELGAPAAPRR